MIEVKIKTSRMFNYVLNCFVFFSVVRSNLVTMPPRYYATFDRPQQKSIENIGVAKVPCHSLISELCHVW